MGHDFPEKRQKGGGVISDLKIFIANLVRFGPVWKKIAIFFSEKGAGGGGQRPFGNFPEIRRYWKRRASLRDDDDDADFSRKQQCQTVDRGQSATSLVLLRID